MGRSIHDGAAGHVGETFIETFADIGTDEINFNPATDDPDEIERLAQITL